MHRRTELGACVRWVLIIGILPLLVVGCGGGSSGGKKAAATPGVNLTGVVDDGGPNSPVPGASCVFIDDNGPQVGPVIAGADGRFTLRVPPGATGRIVCTPPDMTDLVLVARVAAGQTAQDVGEVDPETSLFALVLESEIDDGELDPADVAGRSLELEFDDDLSEIVDALDLVVEALLTAGLDADLLEVVLDLHDNARLDNPDFAAFADAVNALIESLIDTDDLIAAIEEYFDLFFDDMSVMADGKMLIEHNATDEDTGFQSFADGDPWNRLDVADPGGAGIVTVNALGGLFDFGLTELFFETSEPAEDEVPIDDVLARLAEGDYRFTGEMVDDDPRTRFTEFTHDIPAGPALLTPADESTGLSPVDLLISWEPVTEDIDGDPIEIVGYQVIVEEETPVEFPQGFARPVFSVYLPATATQVTVPNGFLKSDGCYKYEVLAIEESGNQSISEAVFETGTGCEEEEEEESEDPVMVKAKLLIEHNATDEDTGFQCFGDGDPWNKLTVTGPGGVDIVMASAAGGLFDFGLTELFFETSEPPNDEVSIPDVLAHLPEGTYTFTGEMVDGGVSSVTTEFTHTIPNGPVLVSPADGAEDVDPANLVVSWQPVTTDIHGSASITIVGYQVIVELDEAPEYPLGFAKPVFSIYLPASATQVEIPAEFMLSGEDYEYEVLAIEESGNQTLTSAEFSTQ